MWYACHVVGWYEGDNIYRELSVCCAIFPERARARKSWVMSSPSETTARVACAATAIEDDAAETRTR
jgi:hypothetical protein